MNLKKDHCIYSQMRVEFYHILFVSFGFLILSNLCFEYGHSMVLARLIIFLMLLIALFILVLTLDLLTSVKSLNRHPCSASR